VNLPVACSSALAGLDQHIGGFGNIEVIVITTIIIMGEHIIW
jgi:hypothetical protein